MLRLEIVTPEHRVLDADVDAVTVTTASGEVGILPNHAPLISALKPGVLAYSVKGVSEKLAISGGFIEVNANKVAVLADTAESPGEIDIDAARLEKEDAERSLASTALAPVDETDAVREALEAAKIRIQFASGK